MGPLTGIGLRCARARSWMGRAKALPNIDLDARFIFWWIAFSALYGQVKYRRGEASKEFEDIEAFVRLILKWDRRAIDRLWVDSGNQEGVGRLLRDKFLDLDCWRKWDAEGIVERTAREECCNQLPDKRPYLVRVFNRLYVLRNQIFHGCSKDGGKKNRPSLEVAVPVLAKLVEHFIDVVEAHDGAAPSLDDPPFRPSQDSAAWNKPRVASRI